MTDRSVEVRILGDSSQLRAQLGSASKALAAFGGDAAKAANANVASAAKNRDALAQLATAYKQIAAEAKAGSDVQVAADEKAAAAERELAGATVQSADESSAAWAKASAATGGFAKSMLGFTATFLGAEGGIAVVKDAVTQAENLQKAHDSLDTSITRLGGDFAAARPEIDAWAASQQRFGVSITDSEQGLARLIPLTGSVKTAMTAYSLALELSKGDNIGLSQAETAVAKALDGKATSLQRYGIVLAKGATQEQVATAISQRFGGQAEANTTSLDKLHASVSNIELKLGQALLPDLEKLGIRLSDWFSNQQNVNRVTDDAKKIVGDAAGAVETLYDGAEKVANALGGWKTSLELVAGAWAALKLESVLASLASMTKALFGVRDAETAVAAADPFAALAIAAGVAAAEVLAHWKQVKDFIDGIDVASSPQFTRPAENAYSNAAGDSAFEANGVYYKRTPGSAYPTVISKSAYEKFVNAKGTTLNSNLAHPGAVSPAQVRTLLEQAGLSPGAAAVLANIDVRGENASGNLTAMNVNANGTYDYGLFQINSSHKPSTMTDAQWKAYLANPANNAKQAVGILSSQGFGAWTEKYGRAAAAEYPKGSAAWNLLMGGVFGGSIPEAEAAAKAKKPSTITGGGLVPGSLSNEVSTLADKARNAVGAAAAADLKAELDEVNKEIDSVSAKLKPGATGKQADAIKAELTTLQNKKRDLDSQITDALSEKDAVNTVAKFTAQLKAEQAQNKRLTDAVSLEATYQMKTNLGDAAASIMGDYKAINDNLDAQQQTLLSERNKLTGELVGAGVKTTAYIKSQIAKVNNALGSVATAIQSNLKSEADQLQQDVNTIASQVSSSWSAVASDITSEFEAQTQAYITNVLGPQYFQNGLQTPLEAQLAQMQQQDQLTSLQDAVTNATDPDSRAAAQRQLDEYNLQIQATAQRAQADKQYAAAVQQYTDQRTVEEHKLSIALDAFGQGLADNKNNLGDLNNLLTQYGIPNMGGLSDQAGLLYQTDFPLLSQQVGDLAAATQALTSLDWQLFAKMGGTGAPPVTGDQAVTNSKALSSAVAAAATNPTPATIAGAHKAAQTAGYTQSLGYLTRAGVIPALAAGGIVAEPTLIYAGEAGPEAIIPLGAGAPELGGRDVHIHFHGGTFIGGNKQQVARDLKPYIDRVVSF